MNVGGTGEFAFCLCVGEHYTSLFRKVDSKVDISKHATS